MNYPNHTRPKSKKSRTLLIAVLVAFTAVAACICGVAVATSSSGKKPAAAATTVAAAAAGCEHGTLPSGQCTEASAGPKSVTVGPAPTTAAAKPATPTITDGTWTVGEDFPPGTYKTVGAGSNCYWSIFKSGTNQSDIIDNHIGGGNLRVTLKTGQDFETDRCGTWTKV